MDTRLTVQDHRDALADIERQRKELRARSGMGPAADTAQDALSALERGAPAAALLQNALDRLQAADDADYFRRDEELHRRAKFHYNAIQAHRRANKQGRVNTAQRAATYAAACPRCYAVHAGDCY